jgi:hypothetical protein
VTNEDKSTIPMINISEINQNKVYLLDSAQKINIPSKDIGK